MVRFPLCVELGFYKQQCLLPSQCEPCRSMSMGRTRIRWSSPSSKCRKAGPAAGQPLQGIAACWTMPMLLSSLASLTLGAFGEDDVKFVCTCVPVWRSEGRKSVFFLKSWNHSNLIFWLQEGKTIKHCLCPREEYTKFTKLPRHASPFRGPNQGQLLARHPIPLTPKEHSLPPSHPIFAIFIPRP